tara:strand:- start:8352 stop:9236 length:885 start_codon:yes stop_codon:yes gene_type:complete
MIEFNKLTIIIPSLLSNLNGRWIKQINRFNQQKINIIISIPPNFEKKNQYINKFNKEILIIRSDEKGQVNQRQYGYKFVKTEYLMHMDDDVFISIKNLKILLNQFENLPRKSSIAPRLVITNYDNKKLFFKKYINLLIYNEPRLKPGTILKSTFQVSHDYPIESNKEIESVDWIPGAISIIRKENIIKNKYFNFEGKAYCEDLIYSKLLKNNGVKLFLSNKSFFKTEIQQTKDLNIKDFIKFIKNDFKARNYYRKAIKNPLKPFLIAYCILITKYFLTKIIINVISFKKTFFRS